MDNPETQAALGTRHRIKTYKRTTTKTQYGKLIQKQRGPSKKKRYKKTTTQC